MQSGKDLHQTIPQVDEDILKKAATLLRQIIQDYIDCADEIPWPPTVESSQVRQKRFSGIAACIL